ncbi:cytochrome P450 [Streptomyces viridosporus ATCC 14672]|uniref:Cytochrome P450 n=1 Tax=Streptomyces viridosporus (strain ATCC 14672 / DSM 40746 / JCM 4963 / KCTC 9882 / NRRL B-12104 / FH 1290) TaxID=566461 RepID=D5ZSA4_STRV1|nr:cytochrome P450 [Streptomyces viridosporus]EFE70509.1 cytochrome P450 [Streptomyces viridosporus ATCC 14672]
MTPESHSPTGHPPTGADVPRPGPPPGCPAHGQGPGGLRRLHEADDLRKLYEELRAEHGPVAPALLHDDLPVWVVLGHAENLHMVRTPAQYCRDTRTWSPLREGLVRPDHPLMPHIAWQPICAHAEGDEHKRLRGAIDAAVATIDFRTLRRHINRSTQRVVNRFCEKGEADLVGQYAEHLPMAVMCQILGMPDEYDDRIVEAARDMIKGTETANASNAYIVEALGRLTARRRAEPVNDFASHLVTHPAGLTDEEVREHLRLVLIAAYETTANLLANVLRQVLIDPRFRAQLNGGQMTVPEAVEQLLWDEPPFSTTFGYFAKQETELGGRRIRKGDGLLFAPAPANVDPRVRPDPTADMQGNRSHLAFGGGPHECPGQDIGRAIAEVGVDALLMRLPDVELDIDEDELVYTESIASRHLVALPVRFTPRPQQDVTQRPSHQNEPPARQDWHIGAARPQPAPSAAAASERRAEPAPPPGPGPVPPPQPAAEPARPRGAWQRFLLWWRGY